MAAALLAKAPDLLAKPPSIEKIDIVAAKLPAQVASRAEGPAVN